MNAMQAHAANDNAPFEAVFEKLPELFLKAYQQELFGWAKNLTQGNQCTIELWNYAGSSLLSMDWQGRVTLQCDAYANPLTKKMRFVIRPIDDETTERIARHCEEIPRIMESHRKSALAALAVRPKMARWVFDGTVPDYFAERYQLELREWAANLKKIGTTKHIILREGGLANISPDPEQGAELVQVTLTCKIERVRGDEIEIVVSAADENQQRRIRKHCEKMQGAGVPPGAVLVEPLRPGLPMLPTIKPPVMTVPVPE